MRNTEYNADTLSSIFAGSASIDAILDLAFDLGLEIDGISQSL